MDGRIETIRGFNRFYTRHVGALQSDFLGTPFSLAEGRVLYELAHREHPTATELGKELGLDNGYLSRILQSFSRRGLVRKAQSKIDARQNLLSLTPKGRQAIGTLDRRQHEQIAQMLGEFSGDEQERICGAMRTIQDVLSVDGDSRSLYLLRSSIQPGDVGWVVQRHGELYAKEYGWNEEFEALVAEIAANFVKNLDPKRERCWIAERDGTRAGCIFLVHDSPAVAKLRLLLVDPKARGLGIGKRLVDECVEFARRAGYRKITLWTNDVLRVARHVYEEAGFKLAKEERHHSFGKDLVGQNWELLL